MQQNPYQPPNAALANETDNGFTEGSLQTALSGDYDVSVGSVVKDAWRLTKGNKGAIWLAVLAAGTVFFFVDWLAGRLGVPDGQEAILAGDWLQGYFQALLKGFFLAPVTAPLSAGMLMLGIKRVGGEPVGLVEIFGYFKYLPMLVLISIISAVLTYAGFVLLILPGIYLTVAYVFAIPLMLDRQLSPWESLETSRKAVTKHWFSVFGTALVVYLLGALLSVTLVGIIWAAPMMLLAYGILYRRIFGFGGGDRAAESSEKAQRNDGQAYGGQFDSVPGQQ